MRALALLELDSIAVGVRVGDAMVKSSPVDELFAGTVHPGKYIVLVTGDVACVEEALEAGRAAASSALLDEVYLPDPHPDVPAALRGTRRDGGGEALGIVETRTVAALVAAADCGVKGADVTLREIRVADDLGGKSYCVFRGVVADVEEAVAVAVESLRRPDLLVGQVVIPQLHGEMDENLLGAPEFRLCLRREPR